MTTFSALVAQVRACTICKASLPLGPRPVIQIDPAAKILIAGQAPGTRVHASGVPFDDPSGVRLREWLGVTPEVFYDPTQVALLPMGFCYPGTGKSGDLPPRPECEPAWRASLLGHLNGLELTIVLGQYAQAYHYGKSRETLTDRVKAWQGHWPSSIPLPHPSPRNNMWLRRNPWFEAELIPVLRGRVAEVLAQ
jgi:uracil-DNA glycosylase